MRERHQRNGGTGSADRCDWNSEHRDRGHRRDSDLDLPAALIFRVALLQTGVLVDGLAAILVVIGLRKGHGRRLRHTDAGMDSTDRLCEQQRGGNQPASQFTRASGKHHATILNPVTARVDLAMRHAVSRFNSQLTLQSPALSPP